METDPRRIPNSFSYEKEYMPVKIQKLKYTFESNLTVDRWGYVLLPKPLPMLLVQNALHNWPDETCY